MSNISPAELAELAQNYRLTPATLYKKLNPDWIGAEFLKIVSMRIAHAVTKGNGRLLISWPPRHGKSTLATIATPIWVMENFPNRNIMLTSYGEQLSTDFGRVIRDTLVDKEHLLNVKLKQDLKRAAHFQTTQGGNLFALGMGGTMTGRGADVLLVDDYLKSMEDAYSQAMRDYCWNWLTGTGLQRLEPNGTVIIIATRWHEDDLIGRLLKYQPNDWEYICLSAICEDEDSWIDQKTGRKVGEALFPDRYPVSQLEQQKKAMGNTFFSAIYQQKPISSTDLLTDDEWLKFIEHRDVPMNDLVFARGWDFGGGDKKKHDFTVGGLIGVNKKTHDIYILDIFRKRMSPGDIETKVEYFAAQDGPNTKIIIEQEPGAGSKQLISIYDKHMLQDRTVIASPATKNKIVRAQPFLARCQAGKVHVVKASWNEDFINEFKDFPEGTHDDQIDVISIVTNELLQTKPGVVVWGREIPKIADSGIIHGSGSGKVGAWGRNAEHYLKIAGADTVEQRRMRKGFADLRRDRSHIENVRINTTNKPLIH